MLKRHEMEAELKRDTAYSRINDGNYSAMDGVDRTRVFHEAMGLPVRAEPAIPSLAERILRAKLLMEETLETINKGLGLSVMRVVDRPHKDEIVKFGITDESIEFLEHGPYDPIETLDGLADVKVIANGTAVQFGLPLHEAEYEVWASNMTKLDEFGNPIHNVCKYPGHDEDIGIVVGYDLKAMPDAVFCNYKAQGQECTDDSHLVDPTKPRGKVLKPDNYVPANIVRIFVRFAGDEDEAMNRAWLLAHGESE